MKYTVVVCNDKLHLIMTVEAKNEIKAVEIADFWKEQGFITRIHLGEKCIRRNLGLTH